MSLAPKGIPGGKSQANDSGQSTAKDAYDAGQEAVAAQRPAVDALTKDLWDSIEFALRADEPSSLRRKARASGVSFTSVMRKRLCHTRRRDRKRSQQGRSFFPVQYERADVQQMTAGQAKTSGLASPIVKVISDNPVAQS